MDQWNLPGGQALQRSNVRMSEYHFMTEPTLGVGSSGLHKRVDAALRTDLVSQTDLGLFLSPSGIQKRKTSHSCSNDVNRSVRELCLYLEVVRGT